MAYGVDVPTPSHLTAALPSEDLARDAEVLRAVFGELHSPQGRAVVAEIIEGFAHDGVVMARRNELVTPREAGELLGVSRQFVDKLIAEGRLPVAHKPGSRHRVIRVSDLLELESARREAGARVAATIDELVDAGAEY